MKEDYYDIVDIYDYLVNSNNKGMKRLSGMITKKQTIFLVPKDDASICPIHVDIIEEILKRIFPRRKKNKLQDAENEIDIFSNGYDFVIILPDKISINQFEALLKVISEVKRFEQDYNRNLELSYEPNNLIEKAKSIIAKDIEINPKEKVIGSPHINCENDIEQIKKQILKAKHFSEETKQIALNENENKRINIKRLIKFRKK